MLRWSIASVCMGGALEGKLAAAAKAGFRAVELFENDLTFFNGKPRDARRMAADLGLEIVALQPLARFRGDAGADPGRNIERAARKLELMHELGADCSASAPTSLRRRSTIPREPRRTWRSSPISPDSTACGSATRRSPGAGT